VDLQQINRDQKHSKENLMTAGKLYFAIVLIVSLNIPLIADDYKLEPLKPLPCIEDSSYLGKPFYIGAVKVVNAFMGGQCSLHIFHDPQKVAFHRIKFSHDGGFEHFVSSPSGISSRHYYLHPNKIGPFQIQLNENSSHLYVDTNSASRARINVKDGALVEMEGIKINPDTDFLRDPVGSNRPVLGVRRGYLVDSGVRYGVDARIPVQKREGEWKLKYSKVFNNQNQTCYVPNFYLYHVKYDGQGYADSFRFLFEGKEPATVPYKEYLDHAQYLPDNRKRIYLKQIGLIDPQEGPDNETFPDFLRRFCPDFES